MSRNQILHLDYHISKRTILKSFTFHIGQGVTLERHLVYIYTLVSQIAEMDTLLRNRIEVRTISANENRMCAQVV
jgi:hypothetical protein